MVVVFLSVMAKSLIGGVVSSEDDGVSPEASTSALVRRSGCRMVRRFSWFRRWSFGFAGGVPMVPQQTWPSSYQTDFSGDEGF